jgi:predicted transcriptional regulator
MHWPGVPTRPCRKLGETVGLTQGRVSTRLTKLAEQGLAVSPMCIPTRYWALTEKGRALAAAASVVILDHLDRQVLTMLVLAPMRQGQLASQVGCCTLTAKRRLGLLVSRGLAKTDELHRYVVTDQGREAVPDAPKPWVKITAITAANSRDVIRRLEDPTEMPSAERSRLSSLIAHKARLSRRGKFAYNSAVTERSHARAG